MGSYKFYQVVKEFDSRAGYCVKIRPAVAKCLSLMRKGSTINPKMFATDHSEKINTRAVSSKQAKYTVYESIEVGLKIGLLHEVDPYPMKFEDFCNLETVNYFQTQLRGLRCQNLKNVVQESTKDLYLRHLFQFNNWLIGKKFEFSRIIQTGSDSFKKETTEITIENIEHFLKLYQQSFNTPAEYVKVIKKFLLDPKHKHKKVGTMNITESAIKSYFDKNEHPIQFNFNPVNHDDPVKHDVMLSLNDLYKLLTAGRPSITQKAVILCKFQRGLDTLTLCDRFNFEVWGQLVLYFEIEDYMRWNLSKCPVPITLTRIKTNFSHLGFLDIDAVESIQEYLKYREEKTGRKMEEGMPLFLNQKNGPIAPVWVRNIFTKISTSAGLQEKLPGYHYGKNKINSHEVRDLLKSTLITCGTRIDVADHVIGHMPKDSYEKQAKLYPESMRAEYMKGSHKINIFSNVTNYLKGKTESVELQRTREELESIRKSMDRKEREKDDVIDTLMKNQKMVFALLNILQNEVRKPSAKGIERYKPLLDELQLYIE